MTPYETLEKAVNNISWGQVWAGVVFVFLNIIGWTIAVYKSLKRAGSSRDYIEQMATNDLPHTFRALVNIDKNIAKLSGGDEVNWEAVNIELGMGKKKD